MASHRPAQSSVFFVAGVSVALISAHASTAKRPAEIVVVKTSGISAYTEAAEEFADRCRVRARVINLDPDRKSIVENLVGKGDVVLALGQRALNAVVDGPARVVAALAHSVPSTALNADPPPPPELVLRALRAAKPTARRIGVVYGPRTEKWAATLVGPAQTLGITLVLARSNNGPEAVRELHRIAPSLDALWLAPDLEVMTSQLFEYVITLEIQRALPIAAVTRQQVRSGALLAIDGDPRTIGRQAAEITNRLLAGEAPTLPRAVQQNSLEITVNGDVAHRLGIDLRRLVALGARVE